MDCPTEKQMNEMYDYYVKQKKTDYANCTHPYRKQGCCDLCGKDLIGE